MSQDVFRFVPLQNFTDESYIDWSKSISEIDTQLYAKYKLSDEEISEEVFTTDYYSIFYR